jgi:hypothetical protein
LNQLQQIVLRNNSLKGPLPIEFGNLKRLEFLELQHNKLSGPIPEQWEGMDLIRDLMIHDNDLTGMIPPGFRNLRNLTQFYVQNNMLKGEMITSTVPNSTYRFTPQRSEPVSILSPVFIPALISSLVAFGVLVVGIYSFYRFRRIKVAEPLEPSVNDTDTDYSDNEEHIYAHDPETGEVHEIDPIDNTELPEPVSIIQNNK